MRDFYDWELDFRYPRPAEPRWERGASLRPAVLRSLQRFQVGESGDGANLIAKADAAGPASYARTIRLFVAEEQDHARLLALLLTAAGSRPIDRHWSDTVFVRLRRALGLRLELMVLLIAEVVALRYYRALRDGSGDPLAAAVGARILADERRHVPFHCDRLRPLLLALPWGVRVAALVGWWLLLAGVLLVVAVDHGPGLRELGVTRGRFCCGVLMLFGDASRRAFGEWL